MTLYLGDAKEILKRIQSNSIDAVVTDPPYGLSFMGSKWDYDVPTTELWREVFRVLKPGGHLLAFFGTRTYHRGVVRIEDAGFEIRDQIQWIYGQGWPKSFDISKAIDKAAGAEREVVGDNPNNRLSKRHGAAGFDSVTELGSQRRAELKITAPATPEAKRWQGWGTALKPANEPIVLARKPLEKGLTVAENVLKWGTGAINVDETRIGNDQVESGRCGRSKTESVYKDGLKPQDVRSFVTGRFPANLILDETAAELLDAQSGNLGVSRGGNSRNVGNRIYGKYKDRADGKLCGFGDSGGASRFFYVAKASKRERNAGLEKTELVWENDAWEKQDLKSALMDTLQLARATSADILTDEFSWSIDGFGNNTTALCPKALTYTIRTALKLITELKTSNVSPSLSIRESIQDAIRTIEANGLSLVESAERISQLLPNITNEKTASVLGVVHALLQTLRPIRDAAKTGNFHNTVKPIKLMEYLCKLVTPPGGVILDPFMGSGSTGCAAKRLGFDFVGIELDPEYFKIAMRRIEHWSKESQVEFEINEALDGEGTISSCDVSGMDL